VNEYWLRAIAGLILGLTSLDVCWLSRLMSGKEHMVRVQININDACKASGKSLGERRMMGEDPLITSSDQMIWSLVSKRVFEQLISLALGTLFGLTAA
jgi:hypothetical protein